MKAQLKMGNIHPGYVVSTFLAKFPQFGNVRQLKFDFNSHFWFVLTNQICNLRLSHLFPRQADGQSHTSGPTHRPPFMHAGSHTPAGRDERQSSTSALPTLSRYAG